MSAVTERLTLALADRYRIERHLGAGGMATVYLAEDLKHKRQVALKVLKPELAAVLGAERFVQEITTTASLSHPHILPLFDSGTADGFLYYVMPYIKGETLRDKLNRETQLDVDEAVRIASEVADALDYAHRNGVIHRDIKPENILLHDGRPMVADFGIALAVSAAAGGRMTETGLSLGTPHYMSPEQATAEKEITARSDVYSLASVLYEMLAGEPPHSGGSAQAIIMKIIAEPAAAVTRHRKSVPANVAAAVAKALEKVPADRFASAKAFAEALTNPAFAWRSSASEATPVFTSSRSWNRVTVVMTAIAAALAILLIREFASRGGEEATPSVVRFALADDPSQRVFSSYTRPFAISPDGRTIVFAGYTDSLSPRLFIRTLDDARARPLDGTEEAANAAFSPDGEWIAFVAGNLDLKKLRLSNGTVAPIARLETRSAALSWLSNDELLAEQIGPLGPIQRLAVNGGRSEVAIPFDTAAREVSQRRPLVLRGTDLVVYGSLVDGETDRTLVLHRMSDARRVRLGIPGIGALAFVDGHLIYSLADGTLMAVALDTRAMRTRGAPVALEPRATSSGTGTAVGLSEGGTLVHRAADVAASARLELVDTSGIARTIRGDFEVQGPVRFSRDGRRLAFGMGGRRGQARSVSQRAAYDLWVVDVVTGEPTRVTTDGLAADPAWSPDGTRLIYASVRRDQVELWSTAVNGAGASRLIELGGEPLTIDAVPDGRSVVVSECCSEPAGTALLRAWIDGSRRIDTLVTEQAHGVRPIAPRVSPDGRLVAYIDQTTSEIYVRPLGEARIVQVSIESTNRNPVVWGRDSRRLFYVTPDGLTEIELETAPTVRVLRRRVLRDFPRSGNYDLSPDGRTFALVSPLRWNADVVVTVNWLDEARRAWRAAEKP